MKGWVPVTVRMPTPEDAGAFGTVEVILQCNTGLKSGPLQGLRIARPIFIGKDPNRVLWVTMEDKSGTPIENAAWFVSHWRPFPAFPKPTP